ncbi:C40 family peptidase [Streptomyces sp. NPDC055254]
MTIGLLATPVALGLGAVLLVAALGDDRRDVVLPAAGAMRVGGRDGVPAAYAELIIAAAGTCDRILPPSVLAAQLHQESGFVPTRTSPAGARGIAQFMPDTWRTWGRDSDADGIEDIWNPRDAIPAQAALMCHLLGLAHGRPDWSGSPVEMALAGYNAGWGRVVQFRGVPPVSFARGETYHYVRRITERSALYAAAPPPEGDALLPAGFSPGRAAPAQVRTAVTWALAQRGGDYRLGGDCTDALGPEPARWCDCSSLVQQAYAAAGIPLARTTYDQVKLPRRIALDDPKPGDLVFTAGSDGSEARPGHVGMYLGDGLLIEAPRTGVRTRVVPYATWRHSTRHATRVTAVRRVVAW